MTDYRKKVARLLASSRDESNWPAAALLRDEAARIADSHNDLDLAYAARKMLIEACLMADQGDQMLPAFAWCLAQSDRDPDRFWWNDVLWEYRWVISVMPDFPTVSRAQIDDLLADMTRRYVTAGASQRPVHVLRRVVAIELGDRAMAARAARAIVRCPRDHLSDTPETEAAFEKGYQEFLGRTDRVIELIRPVLRKPRGDGHFYGYACADVLLPLLRRGKAREAMAAHRAGYRLSAKNVRYVESVAKHIAFLALTDNLAPATRFFASHLPQVLAIPNQLNRLKFLIDVMPLLDRLKRAGEATIKLRLPDDCPVADPKNRPQVDNVRDWLRATAGELAAAFDRRNGNDYYTKRLAAAPRLQRLFAPCPLQPK